MSSRKLLFQALATAALVGTSGAAQAALTVYTTQAAFTSAIAAPGVDTYADFLFNDYTPGPITRNAGPYGYVATTDSNGFFGVGTLNDTSLSTNSNNAPIVLSGFSPNVSAIGANFFGNGLDGLFLAGDVVLNVTDSTGATVTRALTSASTASFLGFVSTGRIAALVITSVTPSEDDPLWPTIDNLTLSASLAPVPEPGTSALMLAGLATVGTFLRRRRA